jgi:hypothetical protein
MNTAEELCERISKLLVGRREMFCVQPEMVEEKMFSHLLDFSLYLASPCPASTASRKNIIKTPPRRQPFHHLLRMIDCSLPQPGRWENANESRMLMLICLPNGSASSEILIHLC